MNIVLPSLYPHQESLRDRTRTSVAMNRWVIMCAGCGVGKTRIAKWILGASANRNPAENASGKSLFVVQGRPLVGNASQSFGELPELPHGVIMSGEDTAYGKRVQVASIDTMLSWFIDGGTYPSDITFDLIVCDEAENHFPKFARFLKYHEARRKSLGLHPSYGIGLTATPQADGFADVYKDIVMGPPTEWLIANGYLAPFRYFRGEQGKLDLLKKRCGEFTNESVSTAMDGLSGDLVRDWKRFAEGRPTVGFFPRRKHAKEAMAELEQAGLRVAYVDANTPDTRRWAAFRMLDNYDLDYLCNVNLVGRGTDIPAVSCIQLCTAVASIKAYLQRTGRGSRFHPDKYPLKRDCIVIDHGGNTKRLGYFEDERHWSLDITSKDPGDVKRRPVIECPACRALYRGGKCSVCGYEPKPRERAAQGLEFDGTELVEVKREEKKKATMTPEQLMKDTLYRAGRSGRTWRQAYGIFRRENEKQGTNYRIPKTVTIAGHSYAMLKWDSGDTGRCVSTLYPFTVGGGHGGDYLIPEAEPAGAPY